MFLFTANKKHSVRRNTLRIKDKNAICTYIPKNACSTLRYSVAVANGRPDSAETLSYIHKGMPDAMASPEDIASASYSFAILRCPYRRIVSAFLNKAAIENSRARSLFPRGNRLFRPNPASVKGQAAAKALKSKIDALTFGDFMTLLQGRQSNRIDTHFRRQTDFLLKQDYTDFFALEALPDALLRLQDKIGLRILDRSDHAVTKLQKLDVDASQMTIAELIEIQASGFAPPYANLFTSATRRAVETFYADDFALYKRQFGSENLLFAATGVV